MAALTGAQLIDEVAVRIGTGLNSSDDIRTSILRAVNHGGRRVWTAKNWHERRVEKWIPTIAAYTTGTVAVTVASASIVGTGTTWTSAMVGRKFALTTGSDWYRVLTFVDTTHLTLDRVYVEATASGSAYTIYDDEYDLATTVETTLRVDIMSSRNGYLARCNQTDLDRVALLPNATGVPFLWASAAPISTTPSTRRIRLYPIPDAAYSIRVRGLIYWTDLSDGSSAMLLPQDCERAVILAATLEAQEFAGQNITTESAVRMAIEEVWTATQSALPRSSRRRRFDSPYGAINNPFNGTASSA